MNASSPSYFPGLWPAWLWIAFLGLAWLPACRPRTAETAPAEQETTAPAAADTVVREGIFPLAGPWISRRYLDDLRRTHSPRKAQMGSEEVFLELPSTWSGTATLHYNFHEIIPDLRVEANGDDFKLVTPGGPAYDLVRTKDGIKCQGRPFVSYPVRIVDGWPFLLEQELFEGMYQLSDGQRVTFDDEGHVRGLGAFKYYQPRLDYFDEGLQVDQVALGPSPDHITWYGFDIRQDKLTLYVLRCKEQDQTDGRCVETAFGAPVFTLTKMPSTE